MQKKYAQLIYLTAIGCFFPINAFAYLDPGTGSIIIQALIAGVAAAGLFFREVKNFFLGLFSRKVDVIPGDDDSSDRSTKTEDKMVDR